MTTSETSGRLIAFGDRLRNRRLAIKPKMTGKALANLLGWRPMKVSLIETGKQMMTEPELSDWARVIGLSAADYGELKGELQAIRLDDARWKERLRRAGHESAQKSFASIEDNARKIVIFESALVPGPLQTPAYARAVFASMARLKGAGDDVDAAVAARMERQHVLYDDTKTIEILVAEPALRNLIAPASTMVGQLDRLIAASQLPSLRFGVVPIGAPLPFVPLHGFWVFDDELLNAEVLHTEVVTRDPDDVRQYRDYLDAMWEVAAEGEAARAVLLRAQGDLALAGQAADS